jgi:hypothetical protein
MLRKIGFGLIGLSLLYMAISAVPVLAQDAEGSGSLPVFPANDANSEFPNTSSSGGSAGGSTGDPTVLPSAYPTNPNTQQTTPQPAPYPSNPNTSQRGFTSFQNPISANTIQEFIARILQFVVQLSVPFAVFFIILTGFRYVMAQGNPEKILEAHRTLLYTVIGIMVLLGAQLISLVIQNTIQQLR